MDLAPIKSEPSGASDFPGCYYDLDVNGLTFWEKHLLGEKIDTTLKCVQSLKLSKGQPSGDGNRRDTTSLALSKGNTIHLAAFLNPFIYTFYHICLKVKYIIYILWMVVCWTVSKTGHNGSISDLQAPAYQLVQLTDLYDCDVVLHNSLQEIK